MKEGVLDLADGRKLGYAEWGYKLLPDHGHFTWTLGDETAQVVAAAAT